jgi:2-methylfumaryl-CoA isomerase
MLAKGALSGLRIVEGSAFVAAPLGGLLMAQLGAEVIRFDQINGGLDYGRWPITTSGESLFWHGLNRGKKSIQIDINSVAGKKIASDLITADGEVGGIFLTNFPAKDWLSYEALSQKRPDLIMVSLVGNYDGSSEVDYTVNPAIGYPLITGAKELDEPVNSVLPTWDLLLGSMAAIAILAAERKRKKTGHGEYITIALSDVGLFTAGALGKLAQAHLGQEEITRDGNYLYGAFGHNFTTRDRKEIMIVCLTTRQWQNLLKATGLGQVIADLSQLRNLDLNQEGNRYLARESLREIFSQWVGNQSYSEIVQIFGDHKVSWGPYQSFNELLSNDKRASANNPIFSIVSQPGIGTIPNVDAPIRFHNIDNCSYPLSPILGGDTVNILKQVLNLSEEEIADLRENRIVA